MMCRFLNRPNPEGVQAIAARAFVEMLKGGFTARRILLPHRDKDGPSPHF